jgi:hypothetical protein
MKESTQNGMVSEKSRSDFHPLKHGFPDGSPGLGFFWAALLESEMILIVLDNLDRV